jgi:hypothetical protein
MFSQVLKIKTFRHGGNGKHGRAQIQKLFWLFLFYVLSFVRVVHVCPWQIYFLIYVCLYLLLVRSRILGITKMEDDNDG